VLVQSLQRTRRITSCPAVDFRFRQSHVQTKHRPAVADAAAAAPSLSGNSREVDPCNVLHDGVVAADDRNRKYFQRGSSLIIPSRLIEDSDDDDNDTRGRQRKPSKKMKTVSRKTGAADEARVGKAAATRHRKSLKEDDSRPEGETSDRLRGRFRTLSLGDRSNGGDRTTQNGRNVVGYSNSETADGYSDGDRRRHHNTGMYCRRMVNDVRRHSDAAALRFAENETNIAAAQDQRTRRTAADSRTRSLDISEITRHNNLQNSIDDIGSPTTMKSSEKGSPSMIHKWRHSFDGFVSWTGLKRRRCPFAAMRSLSLQSCNEDTAAEVAATSAAVDRTPEATRLSVPVLADEATTSVRLPLGAVHVANGIESCASSEFAEHSDDERLNCQGYSDARPTRSKYQTASENSRTSLASGCFPVAFFAFSKNSYGSENEGVVWRKRMTAISRSLNEIDRCHDNCLTASWNDCDDNRRQKLPLTMAEAVVSDTSDNRIANKNMMFNVVEREGKCIGQIDDDKQQSKLTTDHDSVRLIAHRRPPTVRGRHRFSNSRTTSVATADAAVGSRPQKAVVGKPSLVQASSATTPSVSSSSSSPLSSSLSHYPVKHQQRRAMAALIGSRQSMSFHVYSGSSRRGRKGRPLPMLAPVDLRTSGQDDNLYLTRRSSASRQQQQ
jgi:hypothetical protein